MSQPRRSSVVIGSFGIPQDSRVIKEFQFLRKLQRVAKDVEAGKRPVQDLLDLLKRASISEIEAISEVSQNLLQRTFPKTSQRLIRKLSPFKTLIRRLASTKTTVGSKRQILLRRKPQRGGFAFLIPLLAPILGTLLSAGIHALI